MRKIRLSLAKTCVSSLLLLASCYGGDNGASLEEHTERAMSP